MVQPPPPVLFQPGRAGPGVAGVCVSAHVPGPAIGLTHYPANYWNAESSLTTTLPRGRMSRAGSPSFVHGPFDVSSAFVELEQCWWRQRRYAISELDGMRIVRPAPAVAVFRGDCHIRRTRSHVFPPATSGNVIIHKTVEARSQEAIWVCWIARRIRDRCLRSGGRALAVSVSDACGSAAWESSCRSGAQDRLFEWCRAHCLEIREKRCMGGGRSQRPSLISIQLGDDRFSCGCSFR